MARRSLPVLALSILVPLVPVSPLPSGAAGDEAPVTYRDPVEGVVVDPFRPPATPYGAGNRGLEYATAPGAEVRAAAPGVVAFAGPVGATLHVTVRHADGLRTSYSFLESIAVQQGERVGSRGLLGRSNGRFHFGVRAGATYVDPARLLGPGPDEVRLVPLTAEPAPAVGRSALPAGLEDGVEWARVAARGLGRRLSPWRHYARELTPAVHARRLVGGLVHWWERRDDCTPRHVGVGPPPERRIAVLVGGLGSTSERAAIDALDVEALGYAPGDVLRFSYRGGRVPMSAAGRLAALPAKTYGVADSAVDLETSAARLLTLLEQVRAAAPGIPVDVIAHSQGGLVARLALARSGTPLVEHLVTLGSPHQGADLATAAVAIRSSGRGVAWLQAVGDLLDLDLDPGGVAIGQMAETSGLVAGLRSSPTPPGVAVLSVGARGDLAVPAGRTRLDGADHQVIGLVGTDAHRQLPASPLTTREIRLALRDMRPTCEEFGDVLTDLVVSESIGWAEDLAGAVLASGVAVAR